MRRLASIALALVSAGCHSYVAPERLELAFDRREWQLANQTSKSGYTLSEYLLATESRSSWSEALGVTFAATGTRDGIESQSMRLQSTLRAVCPDLTWETLTDTPVERTYHWSIQGCGRQPDQHELGRFIVTPAGTHRVSYVKKTSALSDDEIDFWLQLLARARVVSTTGGK
jgi:hypothetical protein